MQVLLFGSLPVPVTLPSYICDQLMSGAAPFIQFQGLVGSLLSWWIDIPRGPPSSLRHHCICPGQGTVSQCKGGIFLDSFLKVTLGLTILLIQAPIKISCHQIRLIRLRIYLRGVVEPGFLSWS